MSPNKQNNNRKGLTPKPFRETIRTLVIILILVGAAFGIKGCSKEGDVTENNSNQEEEKTLSKAELEELEAQRKEEYGEFYVPLPAADRKEKDVNVKGLYVSADEAAQPFNEEEIDAYAQEIEKMLQGEGTAEKPDNINALEAALAIANATEVNTLVIDVKTDWGSLAWSTEVPLAKELGVSQPVSQDDFKSLLDYMEKKEIYKMARVVTFKDPILPDRKPEHAMQLNSGGIYRDNDGNAWVNPFDEYVWKYVVAISKEAVNRGFDEIHFDYVRFPDGARTYNEIANFPGRDGRPKDAAITAFLQFAREELKDYPAKTSAAIFGTTTKNWEDIPDDIGQGFLKVSNNTDRVAPMVYPSHYTEGWFGFDVPDANPYGVLEDSMRSSIEKNAALPNPAQITPWIQAFTASWVPGFIEYTPSVIAQQIQGSQSVGVDSYLLWNSSSRYDPQIFNYKPEAPKKEQGKDLMGRTPEEALDRYLKGLESDNYQRMYLMTPVASHQPLYEDYAKKMEERNVDLKGYTLNSFDMEGESGVAKVAFSYSINGKEVENESHDLKVFLENGVYKIQPPAFGERSAEAPAETQENSNE